MSAQRADAARTLLSVHMQSTKNAFKSQSGPRSARWTQAFLLFALFFAGLMLLHAPLLRLPYFWDEAGYYVPAARDLYLTGSLIPQTTISNAHPPLIMAWLALIWKLAGYSTLATRTGMLAVAAFSLLGLWRLCKVAANAQVAWATTALTALYPVFFTQSSLAQVDLPAAGLTFWGLAAYLEDSPWEQAVWFSLAALSKETAILAPAALFVYEIVKFTGLSRWPAFVPSPARRIHPYHLLLPIAPLAGWFAYHFVKTGFLLGNPEFFRYNVADTLNPLRIPLAMGMRLWQLFGYLGLYLLTAAFALAMSRRARADDLIERKRIPIRVQVSFLAIVLDYLGFMSAIGGAVLARYMLPVLPLVILLMVATLWRRLRYWTLVVGAVAVAFVAALFTNPPYGFSLEDNLACRDYIVMHAEAGRFLALRYPQARVLTAWPASDELTRPWLGYVPSPFPVVRIEDFTLAQIESAAAATNRFDAALVFSTKYQPPHPMLENWGTWQRLKERYFGYHRDLAPEQIAQRLGGRIVFHKETEGQWVAVIVMEREQNALMNRGNMSVDQRR